MIVEYELAGMRWWIVSRRFPSAEIARLAWEALESEGRRVKGALDLGVYRHGVTDDPTIVTALSHRPEGVIVADRMLAAPDFDLPDEWAEALILRRVKVIGGLLADKAEPGSYAIRRGRRGGRLHPDGTMEEFIGGEIPGQ